MRLRRDADRFKWIGRVEGSASATRRRWATAWHRIWSATKTVSALLRVAELAAELKEHGRTLLDRLDDIAGQYGVYATDQVSARVEDLSSNT